MEIDVLRAELERLFEMDELLALSRDLLGFDPETIGGTAGKGSFVRALTDHCIENDAFEALCDSVAASKAGVSPEVLALGARGTPALDEIRLGDRLGPYVISRKLGEGAAGISYVARSEDGEVRIKVLRREATRDQRALRRFLALTRLSARVRHQGLPWRLRAGVVDGRYFVAQEAVEGQALAARVARTGPMHINEAREILRGVLEALEALHNERLVHGDLKLENVLVYRTADGAPRVLVLDPFCDRLRARPPANGHVEPWSVSSPRTVSPEQLRGHAPTPASDVYSFGALLFELLTGKPVFDTKTIADAMVAHLSTPPRTPSAVAPRGWVTKELDDLVLRLLSKDPAARPRTVAAVLALLDGLGKPQQATEAAPTLAEEELVLRIDAVIGDPENEAAALSLESAVGEGADATRVAEALLVAAEQIDLTGGDPGRQNAAKGLLFRAGRLFQESAESLEGAERAYAAIVLLDPSEGTAVARLDELRQKLGKYDELIESLLDRVERSERGAERAAILSRIGGLYSSEIADPEQALVAFTQAFCEDPVAAENAGAVERLAGNSNAAWGEVLAACNEESTSDRPPEIKNPLFAQMGRWYAERYARPDLALQCFQAILTTDPGSEEALDGLTALYRKAQQWRELGTILLQRADATADSAKARDLRCDAAQLLETQLNDPAGARELYGQILAADPGHARASEALTRSLEQSRDYAGLVKLLEVQAAALRGEDKRRVLCRVAETYEDRLGDDPEAIRRYSAVLAEDPGHADALRGLDRLYSKAGRFADLLENLGQQIQVATTPRQKIALWERVAGIHDEEFLDHGKAAFALEQVLDLDPAHDASLTALPRHYRALSRWDDLATLYERHLGLVSDPPRKLELAVALARILSDQLGATERAIDAYERVLALSPEHGGALEMLARLRETSGDQDAALAALETLAERAESPEAKAEHLQRAAKLLEGRGDRDRAILNYKRALDASPKDTAIATALRAAYIARGDVNAAVELLEQEIDGTEGDRQKAKLAAELATLHRTRLKDDDRADKAGRRALEYDPTNIDALTIVADIAFEAGRFVEAASFYEKLSGRAENLDHDTAVRALERYVDALAKGGSTEKALAAMDTLLRLAPDDQQAVARVALVTFEHGSPARARELYLDLLGRFAETLSAEEKASATYRTGEAARRAGDLDAAIESLESAADLDPASPSPLIALASAYESKESWAKVVDAKTRHLDIASGEDRLNLLVEIGEIAAGKLADRTLATKSLVAALDERPDDRKLLARLMQLYSEEKDWQKLVDVVLKLADFVEDPKQKAKYLQTAAKVTGHEMRDYDQALGYYDRVLAVDPTNHKAVDDSIELLEQKGDYAAAVERLKAKAQAASATQDTARMLEAFNRLVPLYQDKLGRVGHAIDALEAAQTLEPDNKDRNKLLADMYASNPDQYMGKAVLAQIAMLRQNPYRVESYKLLRKLYTDAKRGDAAWCLCQALYVLKLSEPDEERFFRRMRSEDPAYAQQVITHDDWLELIFHSDAEQMLTTLFALVEPAIIASRGGTFESLGYDPGLAVDSGTHPYPVTQTLHYAAGVMGIPLPPVFENQNDPSGLGFLHAQMPSIVLGSAALMANASPQALAFVAGRHLAYFRSGFYVRQLVQSGTGLRAWLFAAIKMIVPQFPVSAEIEGPVREAIAALETHLTPQLRDHLARVVSKLIQSGAALDLKRWVQGVDLTADRAGFALAHDLETAIEIVRASDEGSSALTPQSRLKDLVLYAISEPYFTLRDRLKIGIDG
jgi:tetratricopeptide (TPR) repeat protein